MDNFRPEPRRGHPYDPDRKILILLLMGVQAEPSTVPIGADEGRSSPVSPAIYPQSADGPCILRETGF